MSTLLLEHSLSYVNTADLDRLSRSLEGTAREYYRQAREDLKTEAASGRLAAQRYEAKNSDEWPVQLRDFWQSSDSERFILSGPQGDRLNYAVRRGSELWVYSKSLTGVRMAELADQYRQARSQVSRLQERDLRRGLIYTLILLSAGIWVISLVCVIYMANRLSSPIQELTAGLSRLAGGDFGIRISSDRRDEVGRAISAFNNTAAQIQQSRDRLVYLTQIASWQTLARKMAHELKNSLTPIRLTVEEILARQPAPDRRFIEQAAQVVVDEVESLERRLRAFSEFAAEPQTNPANIDLNGVLEERIQFLRLAHAGVSYELRLSPISPIAWADLDQVRGILTNILENAADAAAGGRILAITEAAQGKAIVEIHDSGPGLSAEARRSLFEPTISFKRHGMGMGLSISRKNALQAGGDLETIEGRLGGAGFRLLLPGRDMIQETHENR